MGKLQDRIDEKKLEQLRNASIPSPIHAVNYVEFKNSRYYRLYGLLLAPYALAKGAKPVWVGLHEANIIGEEKEDEIVVLEYPSHNTLIDIFTSRYYEHINGLREKGVKKLGFSICIPRGEKRKIGGGQHLVVRFNNKKVEGNNILEKFERTAKKYCRIKYLAHEKGFLNIFKKSETTDPLEVFFKNIAILSNDMTAKEVISKFKEDMGNVGIRMTMQRFRTLGIYESMPWSQMH